MNPVELPESPYFDQKLSAVYDKYSYPMSSRLANAESIMCRVTDVRYTTPYASKKERVLNVTVALATPCDHVQIRTVINYENP